MINEDLKAEVKNYIKCNKSFLYTNISISESGFMHYRKEDYWMIPLNFYYDGEAQEALRILQWNAIERQLRKGSMI